MSVLCTPSRAGAQRWALSLNRREFLLGHPKLCHKEPPKSLLGLYRSSNPQCPQQLLRQGAEGISAQRLAATFAELLLLPREALGLRRIFPTL